MDMGNSENLKTLISLPSSMLTILALPSSLVKQMYFFWKAMMSLMGDKFYIFFMRLTFWWFQMATCPFLSATTSRVSPKKQRELTASLWTPN